MQLRLRIALIIVMMAYLIYIARAVKRKNMRMSYLIFMCITAVALIVALAFPGLIVMIANLLGFELAINMIFCVAIFMLIYLIHNLNIVVSKEEKKNTILVQELSILKKKVEEMEKKNNE